MPYRSAAFFLSNHVLDRHPAPVRLLDRARLVQFGLAPCFQWPGLPQAMDKLEEELAELKQAQDQDAMGMTENQLFADAVGHIVQIEAPRVLLNGGVLSVLGAICIAGVVYLVLILVLKVVSKDDLSLMPKGDKIAKLLSPPASRHCRWR